MIFISRLSTRQSVYDLGVKVIYTTQSIYNLCVKIIYMTLNISVDCVETQNNSKHSFVIISEYSSVLSIY